MRYELHLNAYDVLDRVVYNVRMTGLEEGAATGETWTTIAHGTIAGTGESDHREWARDALIAALETI